MNKDDDTRKEMFSQLPHPADLIGYRTAMTAALERERTTFERERFTVQAVWIFCVVLAIGFAWFSENSKGPWLAIFVFLLGATEVVKHAVRRSRLDLLKEVKQVQLQVFELREEMRNDKLER